MRGRCAQSASHRTSPRAAASSSSLTSSSQSQPSSRANADRERERSHSGGAEASSSAAVDRRRLFFSHCRAPSVEFIAFSRAKSARLSRSVSRANDNGARRW
uniref:Uncharacterized protein n=1 Tax=Plectus sambesii TaxID=2011161 RepID=A0A914UM80_9BILA